MQHTGANGTVRRKGGPQFKITDDETTKKLQSVIAVLSASKLRENKQNPKPCSGVSPVQKACQIQKNK